MNATVLSKSVELFQLYYTPVLVYLGVIGNSLCVYVFRSPKLRILSSSYYLSALAISDSVFLLALFTVWLTMVGIDVFNQPGACQIIVFLTGVSSFLSVWFVVAFTVERFIAVRYPLLRHSLCTVQRAKMVIIGLTILSLILYMPLLLFAGARRLPEFPMLCTVLPLWQDEAAVFNILDTFLTFFIPVITIVKLNICISKAVWNLHNIRNRLIQKKPRAKGKQRDPQIMFSPARQKFERRNNSQKKVTKMLLVVSTIFLCLNLPSYIMRVLTYLIEPAKCTDLDGLETIIEEMISVVDTNLDAYKTLVKTKTEAVNHAEYDKQSKQKLKDTLESVAKQVKTILDESGMDGHPELITHCTLAYATDLENLKSSFGSSYLTCAEIMDNYISKLTKGEKEMFDKLNGDIMKSQEITTACTDQTNAEDYKKCLVDKAVHDYETVTNRKQEIDKVGEALDVELRRIENFMDLCYNNTIAHLEKTTTQTVDKFSTCVQNVHTILKFFLQYVPPEKLFK